MTPTNPNSPPRLHSMIAARIGLFSSMLAGITMIVFLYVFAKVALFTAMVVGWNTGAVMYLALASQMIAHTTHEDMLIKAKEQDYGKYLVLGLVVLTAIISLVSIGIELSNVKQLYGSPKIFNLTLTGLTLLTSWSFTQVMFAIHYAHDYYVAKDEGKPAGLVFQDTPDPDYVDFIYLSCLIGTALHTGEIVISSQAMRKTVLLHRLLAFFFNASLFVLAIILGARLL